MCVCAQTNLACKLNDTVDRNRWVPLLHMKLNFGMYLKSSKIQYVLYFISVFPAVTNPLDFYKNIIRLII